MIQRVKDIFDFETAKVCLMAVLPSGLTLANVSTIVQIVVGIGSAIYIWRKVFRKNKKDDETEL